MTSSKDATPNPGRFRPNSLPIDFSAEGPKVHIEIWQTPAGKRRYKIIVEPPWVDFDKDSVIKRISQVADMLEVVEPEKSGNSGLKVETETLYNRILNYLTGEGDRVGTVDIVAAMGASRTKVVQALNLMVRRGILTVQPGVGRGQQSRYSLNRNRTQSVPEPQGTVIDEEEDDGWNPS